MTSNVPIPHLLLWTFKNAHTRHISSSHCVVIRDPNIQQSQRAHGKVWKCHGTNILSTLHYSASRKSETYIRRLRTSKRSMVTVLPNTPDLIRYTKIKISRRHDENSLISQHTDRDSTIVLTEKLSILDRAR